MHETKLILCDKPKLRWREISDATAYSVYLMQLSILDDAKILSTPNDAKILWQQESISGTEIEYPGDPRLELGTPYLLYIESNSRCPCDPVNNPACCPQFQIIYKVDANSLSSINMSTALLEG